MRKYTAITITLLLAAGIVQGLEADIQPGEPDTIVLNQSNDWEVDRQFDGIGSENAETYSWNIDDDTATFEAPDPTITFDRDTGYSEINDIDLVVFNQTHEDEANSTTTTQELRDQPEIEKIKADSEDIKTEYDQGQQLEFTAETRNEFNNPTTYEWSLNGEQQTISETYTHTFEETGEHTIKLKLADGEGLENTETVEITVSDDEDENGDETPDLPPTDEEIEEIEEESFDFEQTVNFQAGEPRTIETGGEVDIPELEITTGSEATDVKIEINSLELDEIETTASAKGQIYSYTQIETELENEEIETAEITFEVEQEWIENNDINQDQVKAQRYTNGSWENLDTWLKENNTDGQNQKLVYGAETPGFSYFAATAITDSEEDEDPERNVAEEVLEEAQNRIGQEENGWELLQQAEIQFDQGNYTGAQQLTEEALTQQEQQDQEEQEDDEKTRDIGLPLSIAAAIAALAIVSASGYITYHKLQEKRLRQKAEQIREQLSHSSNNGQHSQELLQQMQQAEQLLEQQKYRKVKQKFNQIQKQLGENNPK